MVIGINMSNGGCWGLKGVEGGFGRRWPSLIASVIISPSSNLGDQLKLLHLYGPMSGSLGLRNNQQEG